jgi:hypothetical protein
MGGGIGVGGEDRRSDGCAVSSCGTRCRRASLARIVVFVAVTVTVTTISFSLTACSRQKSSPPPDAATLLQAIAAADPAKYPSPQGSRYWSNPYLVIRTDGVGLLTSVAANEEQILKPEEVLNALAQLPASAWPYGRAVAILVEEKPTASEPDKVALRRSRGIVAGDLEGAHVAINWIPTS